jgi:hypothetical protein
MTNYRIILIQQLCILCERELPQRDTTQGLADRLCRVCMQLLYEQVFRDLEQRAKIVGVSHLLHIAL